MKKIALLPIAFLFLLMMLGACKKCVLHDNCQYSKHEEYIKHKGIYYALGIDNGNRYAKIIGCSKKYSGELTFPDSIYHCDRLYCVDRIADLAFYDRPNITSVVIPKNIRYINNFAFYGCCGIKKLEVDPDNPYYDSRDNCNAIIESKAYSKLRITHINKKTGQKKIKHFYYSFLGILDPVFNHTPHTPNTPNTPNYNPYDFCGYYGYYYYRDSILSSNNIKIDTVIIQTDSFPKLGITLTNPTTNQQYYKVFYNPNKYMAFLDNILSSLVYVGMDKYEKDTIYEGNLVVGCQNTQIPANVVKINQAAFAGCTFLKKIDIPDDVKLIDAYAFAECKNLKSINISKGVKGICDGAFYGCQNLNTIKIDSANIVYDSRNNCNAIIEKETNKLIYGCKNTKIPTGVVIIGREAFANCTDLTSIEIPQGVDSIGIGAFSGCKKIKSIFIPESVKDIADWAFYGCVFRDL